MINSYEVNNFKCFKNFKVDIKNINLFLGINSSGKSTIIQSLLLLKQSLTGREGYLEPIGEYIDLGNFKNLIHAKDNNNQVSFSFSINVDEDIYKSAIRKLKIKNRLIYSKLRIELNSSLNTKLNGKIEKINEFKYQIDRLKSLNSKFFYNNYNDKDQEDIISDITSSIKNINILLEEEIYKKISDNYSFRMLINIKENYINIENLIKRESREIKHISNMINLIKGGIINVTYFFNDEGRCSKMSCYIKNKLDKTLLFEYEYKDFRNSPNIKSIYVKNLDKDKLLKSFINNNGFLSYFDFHQIDNIEFRMILEIINDINKKIGLFIGNVSYSAPIRNYPERLQYFNKQRFSIGFDATGKSLFFDISNDKKLLKFIIECSKYLGLFDDLSTKTSSEYLSGKMNIKYKGVNKLSLLDLGFGVSQILPVLVTLGKATNGNIVLLEQPEIHLHPSLQAKLMDIFIKISQEKNLILFIETHSEYMIRRLQRRLIETKNNININFYLDVGMLNLYFVSHQDDLSSSNISKVNITNRFSIEWPKGFYPEDDDRVIYLNNLLKLENELLY